MMLTMGRGPFGHQPAGRFNFDPPDNVERTDVDIDGVMQERAQTPWSR